MKVGVYHSGAGARGGAERLCLVLALDLLGMGHDVTFLTAGPVDRDEIEADLGEPVCGLHFEQLPEPRVPGLVPREAASAVTDFVSARYLRSFDFDLFVNGQYKSRMPGVGRRNVLYCHFPYPTGVKVDARLRRAYVAAVGSWRHVFVDRRPGGFLATYDEIWANSRYTAGHVASMWDRPAQVLYPPCPSHRPGTKVPLILAVGRFQAPAASGPYKAQDRLIEAFAQLTELHPTWRLELAGGTTDRPEDVAYLARLERMADGLPITLRPDCSYHDLEELYSRASLYWHAQGLGVDLTQHPVAAEHFGISTVEAMSAGALPLVIDAGGPAEVVAPLAYARWTTLEQLIALTRRWVGRSVAAREDAARGAVARAHEFDRVHFRRRLAQLLGSG